MNGYYRIDKKKKKKKTNDIPKYIRSPLEVKFNDPEFFSFVYTRLNLKKFILFEIKIIKIVKVGSIFATDYSIL